MSTIPNRPVKRYEKRPPPKFNPFKGEKKPRPENEQVAQALLYPDLFAEFFLQATLWDTQRKIMRAVASKPRVAVKACHSSSKTYTAARIVLWFLARYQDAICVTTAPTWNQVEKLLWGEIHSAMLKSRYPFPSANRTEIKMGPKRYAYGLSTSVTKQDEGVKFQGIHAENVLVILDEAPGVDPKIWEAIEGARAGGKVNVLAIGNPTIASGPFHDAFVDNRSGWETFTIDAFDTPNLRGITLEKLLKLPDEELDQNTHSYLTTRRWVKEKFYEWGPTHPSWEARVRGQFPKQSEDSLLSLSWLEEANNRQLPETAPLTAGLDVAGPGEDETTLTIRRGPKIILQRYWPHADPRGEVVAALKPYQAALEAVNVDCIGIGWGMYTHLLDLKFPAVAINTQETSSDSEKFKDCKAEFYWGLRERFAAGDIAGPLDEKTVGQLAGLRYKHNSRGQVEIESKDQAAKRGVKSPDRAESLMLAFASRKKVYGALDYYKTEQGRIEMEKSMVAQGLMKPMMGETRLACPGCTATCVVKIANGWRCNQCGDQWEDPRMKQQITMGPSRKDLIKV